MWRVRGRVRRKEGRREEIQALKYRREVREGRGERKEKIGEEKEKREGNERERERESYRNKES